MGRFLTLLLACLLIVPETPLYGFALGRNECCGDSCDCAHAAASCCSRDSSEVRIVAACSCNEPHEKAMHIEIQPARIAPIQSGVTYLVSGSAEIEPHEGPDPLGQRFAPEPPVPRRVS